MTDRSRIPTETRVVAGPTCGLDVRIAAERAALEAQDDQWKRAFLSGREHDGGATLEA
jgi:hypothetical protein